MTDELNPGGFGTEELRKSGRSWAPDAPEVNRAWLASLKRDVQAEAAMPCRWCGTMTTRQICVAAVPLKDSTDPHNYYGLGVHQCARCRIIEAIRCLERRQALPDLDPLLRGREAVILAGLRDELAELDSKAA
jgi:hypothetical protein